MAKLLYLVHRLPYPPNKGDKVRSYHLLKHLVARHEVYLGTFVDDPEDEAHVAHLRTLCADVKAVRLSPKKARLLSLAGIVSGQALTLHYYRSAELRRWVDEVVRCESPDAAVVFSSSMAQYADGFGKGSMLVDFVDVDSAKWRDYAGQHSWPLSWLYRREGAKLLAYEREVAARAARSFFVTDKECGLFTDLAPEVSSLVQTLGNGVDAQFFSPSDDRASPFESGELPIVFTGAMDYWPNVDAVIWFAREMLPALRERWPGLRFHIVGRAPAAEVRALESAVIAVTGTVPDVRPYLQHAAVVVAPLRLARGIQNKVLEAMAMGRPVVTTAACAGAIAGATPEEELLAGNAAGELIDGVHRMLADPLRAASIGAAGRALVLRSYDWQTQLACLDRYIPGPGATPPGPDRRNGVHAERRIPTHAAMP